MKQEQKLKQDNREAFDNWVVLKEMREQAVKWLTLIPPPGEASAKANSGAVSLRQVTTIWIMIAIS